MSTIVGGFVGDDRRRMQHTLMVHVFLKSADGLVQRSRFWIGAALRPYAPAVIANPIGWAINRRRVRSRPIPSRAARLRAEHCAAEYANLATLLPELYAHYGTPGSGVGRQRAAADSHRALLGPGVTGPVRFSGEHERR